MGLHVGPVLLIDSKVLSMVQDKPRFQAGRPIVDHDPRDVYSLSAKLFFDPAPGLVLSNDPEDLDLRAYGDEIVGRVGGSSEKKLFRDNVGHRHRGRTREL